MARRIHHGGFAIPGTRPRSRNGPAPGGQVRDPLVVVVCGGQFQRDVRVRPDLLDRPRPDEHRVHELHVVAGHTPAAGFSASDELRRQGMGMESHGSHPHSDGGFGGGGGPRRGRWSEEDGDEKAAVACYDK